MAFKMSVDDRNNMQHPAPTGWCRDIFVEDYIDEYNWHKNDEKSHGIFQDNINYVTGINK